MKLPRKIGQVSCIGKGKDHSKREFGHSNRREYDEDFKRRTVEMTLSGRGPSEIARDLNIPRSCLTRWKKVTGDRSGNLYARHPQQGPSQYARRATRRFDSSKLEKSNLA